MLGQEKAPAGMETLIMCSQKCNMYVFRTQQTILGVSKNIMYDFEKTYNLYPLSQVGLVFITVWPCLAPMPTRLCYNNYIFSKLSIYTRPVSTTLDGS